MALFHRVFVSTAWIVVGIIPYFVRELPQASATEPAAPLAVKVRFIGVPEVTWEFLTQRRSGPFWPDIGLRFTTLADGQNQRPVALLDDKQAFSLLQVIQGDRRTKILLAPRITIASEQEATLNIVGLADLTRGMVLPWDEDPAQGLPPERGIGGVQLTVRPSLCDQRADSVTLKARLIKADHPYIAIAGQPKESRFLAGPLNATVSVPKQGAALVGAWKVVRLVERESGPPVLSKIYRGFNRVSHEREVEVIFVLLTCHSGQIGDEFSDEEEFLTMPVSFPN